MVTEALLASARARCEFAAMLHVTITLSEAQEAQLSARMAAGEFASIDDYVAALVDVETNERKRIEFERQLLEGLEGEAREMTDADWEDLHRTATGR